MPVKKVISDTKKVISKKTTKPAVKAAGAVSAPKKKVLGMSAPVYSMVGNTSGDMELPKEIFGAKLNKALLSQALRVYMNNQRTHWASTKTRSEVNMTKKKLYRQKGTGRARHGAKSAPIFVKGGVALGPKFRKVILDLPAKMKKSALISALSEKQKDSKIKVLVGLEKVSGKTKEMVNLTTKLGLKSTLFVADSKALESKLAQRAVKNLKNTEIVSDTNLNPYLAVRYSSILITKEAIENLKNRLSTQKKESSNA